MGSSPFVQPKITRLHLVDVHRRAHEALLARRFDKAEKDKPTQDDIDDAAARVLEADASGDFIDVKAELTAGEQRKLFSTLVKDMIPGQPVALTPERVGITKLLAYLMGWSFVDEDGQPVPVSEGAIDQLRPDVYRTLTDAIDQHEAALTDKRDAERKNRNGATGSEAISSSVAR